MLCVHDLEIIAATENGKLTERWGRKASGLRTVSRTAGLPAKDSVITEYAAINSKALEQRSVRADSDAYKPAT